MIIMGSCKTEPEWGLVHALAVTSRGTTGFHVGGFVKTKQGNQEYMCEITEMNKTQVHLVGIGWVDIEKCCL